MANPKPPYLLHLMLLLMLIGVFTAHAADVLLQWDAPTTNVGGSPLTDLAGYRVYYGQVPGSRNVVLPVGIQTQIIVSGLTNSQTYYFTVTALDTSQNESAASEEVSWTAPAPPPDTTVPTVIQSSVPNEATNVDPASTFVITMSEAMDAASVNATTMQLRDAQGSLVNANITYNPALHTAVLDPVQSLTPGAAYTLSLMGLTDTTGNILASVFYGFTIAATPPPPTWNCPCSVWASTEVPAHPSDPDTVAVELGMKFRASVAGQITGVRYYKSSQNTGTHVAKLWSRTGQLLASATFPSNKNSGSGWKQVMFSTPVTIQANTTYVVSYRAPNGHYAGDNGYFATARTRGPLTALADGTDGGNGVYKYGSSGFPVGTWQKSNYWVDVIFVPTQP